MNPTYNVSTMPLTWRHWWIVAVASLGQLVGTAVATIAGVIIPLINITRHPELSSWMQGLIGAADLAGIMIGSVIFGRLSDRYGYLLFFRLCPAILLISAVVAALCNSVTILIVCLFFIGIGIGGEYSLDSDYVSELMPSDRRQMMIGVTKTASALGNIIAAALSLAWLTIWHDAADWRQLMWIIAGIGALMFLLRIRFYQSPKWLLDHGRPQEAERAVKAFLGNDVELEDVVAESRKTEKNIRASLVKQAPEGDHYAAPKLSLKEIVLTGVPWACEGLGVYGIGVFIPVLVMALGIGHFGADAAPTAHVIESVKNTLYISCIILPGFLIGVWLTGRKASAPKLQIVGFTACALSLTLLLLSYHFGWASWISLVAFMAFELFLNIGPHLVTYLLPPMVYPVEVRGQGTGIAASMGKFGAVLGVFVVPLMLKAGGAVLVLGVSAGVVLLGAIVTAIFAPLVIARGTRRGQAFL